MFETMQKRELPTKLHGFTTTNQNKASLVDSLALALERREIALLNDPVLISELQAYEAETTVTGLIRYGAPNGQHDDCVMSLLLAYAPNAETSPSELRPQAMATSQVTMSRSDMERLFDL